MLFGNSNAHAHAPAPPADLRDLGRAAAVARRARERPELQQIKRHLSCPPPWDIAKVSYLVEPPRFTIWVYELAGFWPCPICHDQMPGIEHSRVHVFRCVACETDTFVHARIPIILCPRHGRQEVTIPWMAEHEKWTYVRTLTLEEEADQR